MKAFGAGFQLWGFILVFIQINGVARHFDRKILLDPLKSYRDDFPRLKFGNGTGTAMGSATAPAAVASGRASKTQLSGDAPIEQRVAQMEKELDDFRVSLRALTEKMETASRDLKASIEAESSKRRDGFDKLEGRVEEVTADSLHLDLIAVLFFVAGLMIATFSAEIVDFL